jgi:hypothetical protein
MTMPLPNLYATQASIWYSRLAGLSIAIYACTAPSTTGAQEMSCTRFGGHLI